MGTAAAPSVVDGAGLVDHDVSRSTTPWTLACRASSGYGAARSPASSASGPRRRRAGRLGGRAASRRAARRRCSSARARRRTRTAAAAFPARRLSPRQVELRQQPDDAGAAAGAATRHCISAAEAAFSIDSRSAGDGAPSGRRRSGLPSSSRRADLLQQRRLVAPLPHRLEGGLVEQRDRLQDPGFLHGASLVDDRLDDDHALHFRVLRFLRIDWRDVDDLRRRLDDAADAQRPVVRRRLAARDERAQLGAGGPREP